jgi:hypothetical protein
METRPSNRPTVVLPIIKIVFDAFHIWQKRGRLARAMFIPGVALLILSVFWSYRWQDTGTYEQMAWVFLYAVVFTPFAVTCHRLMLMGDESIPRFGITLWTAREARFFGWLLAGWVLSFLVTVLGIMILGAILANLFEIPRDWWQWLIIGFQILGTYVLARVTLMLPAIALDIRPTLAQTWHLSDGNGWRLAIVLGGLPWLLRAFQTVLASDEVSLVAIVLSSLLFCSLLVVEIAAVSLSYRYLTMGADLSSLR